MSNLNRTQCRHGSGAELTICIVAGIMATFTFCTGDNEVNEASSASAHRRLNSPTLLDRLVAVI